MIIIRNLSHDIKEKLHESDKDIRKAIEYKGLYSNLADDYYSFSIERMKEALVLHEEVIDMINQYRAENGEPNVTMKNLWDFEHQVLIDKTNDIKILQEHFKSL